MAAVVWCVVVVLSGWQVFCGVVKVGRVVVIVVLRRWQELLKVVRVGRVVVILLMWPERNLERQVRVLLAKAPSPFPRNPVPG
jgi:hypothetical protein